MTSPNLTSLRKHKASDLYLGINLGHHDSSAAILIESQGKCELMVLEEERLSKSKNAGFYPYLAADQIRRDFDLNSVPKDQVSFSTFFTSLDETWSHIAGIKNKYSITLPPPELLSENNKGAHDILHHEAHLFSCLPGLDPSLNYLIVVSDGCGSRVSEVKRKAIFSFSVAAEDSLFETISVYSFCKGEVKVLDKIVTPVHLLKGRNQEFSPSSHFTGASQVIFGDWNYSGKVMGMAGYFKGTPYKEDELYKILTQTKFNERTTKEYFDQLDDKRMESFIKISGSTQIYFENYMMNLFLNLSKKYPELDNLIYSGGTALNCIFNEKLRKKNLFTSFKVPAWTNDEGVGIGAAIGSYYLKHKKLPVFKSPESPFLGMEYNYSESEISSKFAGYKIEPRNIETVAGLMAQNQIIAWYEGRSECGPRALGHRSILCSPFIPGIRDYLNDHIKLRERFRPYGCSVLEEQQGDYFEDSEGLMSPYMSFAPIVREDQRELLKGIMHADNSIRIQTVNEIFPTLRELLIELRKQTGHSLIIHTSLNINKQPILESIDDAVKFFADSEIKYMVFENYLISK